MAVGDETKARKRRQVMISKGAKKINSESGLQSGI